MSDPQVETLGQRIRRYRKSNGWSQEKLAQLVGRHRQAIVAIESDRSEPRGQTATALAEAFGVSVTRLLTGRDELDT
jgi:transcriptional regulator with XRE-family HTH domain